MAAGTIDYDGRLRSSLRKGRNSGWEDPQDLGPCPDEGVIVLATQTSGRGRV